jgi:hypothetical protein
MHLSRKKSLLLVVAFFVEAIATGVPARDYGQYRNIDPAVRQWVEGLKDKSGQGCCETADGHPAEYEWDIAGNRHRVRIEGEWYVVPVQAVIEGPNKLGYATVWYAATLARSAPSKSGCKHLSSAKSIARFDFTC